MAYGYGLGVYWEDYNDPEEPEDYEPIEREPLEQNKHWCFLCLKIWFDHFPVKRDVCVHCHYEIDEVMGLNPPF